jgi:hypothetical protein
MRLLLLAGLLIAFAAPAFAEGGCDWGKSQTVKAPSPETVVEAPQPQTPVPDGTKG